MTIPALGFSQVESRKALEVHFGIEPTGSFVVISLVVGGLGGSRAGVAWLCSRIENHI